jgi:hypothetical protein
VAQDINNTPNRVRYTATSGQTAFTVPFEFTANADLKLYQNGTLKTITTHYTLTGAGVTGGGTLTLVTGATLNDDILIVRDIPKERQGDFPASGIFDIESLNSQLDKHVMMLKDIETRLDRRALVMGVTDLPEDLNDLPAKASRASKVLAFDANGQPIAQAADAHTHSLSGVAGLEDALDDKAEAVHTHLIADVSGLQSALNEKAATTHSHAISDVTNLQTSLDGKAASVHDHEISDVTGLQTALDAKASGTHNHDDRYYTETETDTLLAGKSNTGHTHDDRYYTETEVNTLLAGKAASSHSHAISDVTNLQTSLDGKAAASHSHAISDVTGLQTALDGKAASSHTHAISNVTGLQTALDGKASTSHTHAISDTTGLQTALDGKAASSHTHTASSITDFSEAVDDEVASLLVAGSNITLTYNDAANTLTIASSGGGGGGSISDGDKGDITVSASGATWTIDAGAVGTSKLGGDITTAGKALLDDADAAAQRTTLGLGSIATQAANSVSITGGSVSGITDLAIADGGTGQSSASAAANALDGYLAITTAAGTTTLDNASPRNIVLTGTLAQTIRLPDVTTLQLGWSYTITNASSGTVTIQSSGANNFGNTLTGGMTGRFVCIALTGTTTGSWVQVFNGATSRTGTGGLVYSTNPALFGATINNARYTLETITAGTNAQNQGAIGSSTEIAVVTTTANNPSGVTLNTAAAGKRTTVFNLGTNPIVVYPLSGTAINGLAANAGVTIPVGYSLEFEAQSATQWRTSSLGTSGEVLVSQGSASAPVFSSLMSSNISNFSEAVDDEVASLLVAGSNITLTYNDAANTLTIASTGGGGGGVTVDEAIAFSLALG